MDGASLAGFRIALGGLMIAEVARCLGHGWITPAFPFLYPLFECLRPWPGVGMYFHFGVLGAAAAPSAAGLGYRPAQPRLIVQEDLRVSLYARSFQSIMDPAVSLAEIQPGFRLASWILPLGTPAT